MKNPTFKAIILDFIFWKQEEGLLTAWRNSNLLILASETSDKVHSVKKHHSSCFTRPGRYKRGSVSTLKCYTCAWPADKNLGSVPLTQKFGVSSPYPTPLPSDCAKHLANKCDIHKVVEVVHRNLSITITGQTAVYTTTSTPLPSPLGTHTHAGTHAYPHFSEFIFFFFRLKPVKQNNSQLLKCFPVSADCNW